MASFLDYAGRLFQFVKQLFGAFNRTQRLRFVNSRVVFISFSDLGA